MNRGLTLISALGFGAGVMYLLDPDRGIKRRKQIRKQANSAVKRARGSLDDISSDMISRATSLADAGIDATERARDRASELSLAVSRRARKLDMRDIPSKARELASSGLEAGARARHMVTDIAVAESARELADSFAHSLRHYAIQLLGLNRGPSRRTWGLFGLFTGAGLMYILDPMQGSQRRARITETVAQTFKGEGPVADLSHEASSMAQRFVSQVRTMVGSKLEEAQEWSGDQIDRINEKIGDKIEEKPSVRPSFTPHA